MEFLSSKMLILMKLTVTQDPKPKWQVVKL